jgi:hypothetical protein
MSFLGQYDAPACGICPALICFFHHGSIACAASKSGGGPPHSRTLARNLTAHEPRAASWTAPALWRFGFTRPRRAKLFYFFHDEQFNRLAARHKFEAELIHNRLFQTILI